MLRLLGIFNYLVRGRDLSRADCDAMMFAAPPVWGRTAQFQPLVSTARGTGGPACTSGRTALASMGYWAAPGAAPAVGRSGPDVAARGRPMPRL